MTRSLTGREMEALVGAVGDAYTVAGLRMMLRFRLDIDIEDIAIGPDKSSIVFALVDAANRQGWWPRLVSAARSSNPGNADLLQVESDLIGQGGAANLEKIVDLRSQFQDVRTFANRYATLENAVCAVGGAGGGIGTGWLVGPDLVLTNYHVVSSFIGTEAPQGLHCRFDFKIIDEATSPGRVVPLAKKWCEAFRRYGTSDVTPGATSWDARELDYALLRLAERVGEQAIGDKPEPGAPTRGWVTISAGQKLPAAGDRLWLFQHPQDLTAKGAPQLLPMKLADGQVLDVVGGGMRIRHDARTLPGSSGSPCCDAQLTPIALHHAGEPKDWPAYRGEFNQAIPIGRVVADLKQQGIEPFWDRPPPSRAT